MGNNMIKKKLLHLTDIHLNFVHPAKFIHFVDKLNGINADHIIITGDITEAPVLESHLDLMASNVKTPMSFVLGNHDYYFGNIAEVRSLMNNKYKFRGVATNNSAYWLGACDFISLSDDVAVVGHDGWYDGGYANWFDSKLQMADYGVILDFKFLTSRVDLFTAIGDLAEDSANHIRRVLPLAFKEHKHVFLGTHVPPFRENSVYNGKISDDHWLPHFSSKYMGDAILEVMAAYPDKQLTVLCGHSHGSAIYNPLPNVVSITGKARYKYPDISGEYEF